MAMISPPIPSFLQSASLKPPLPPSFLRSPLCTTPIWFPFPLTQSGLIVGCGWSCTAVRRWDNPVLIATMDFVEDLWSRIIDLSEYRWKLESGKAKIESEIKA